MILDHIGIAVADLDEADALLARLLGRTAYKRETVSAQQVTTSFFTAGAEGGGAGAKIELVSPSAPQAGPIGKFLSKRGPGLHHLAFETEDIHAEMRRLSEDGFELLTELPSRGADNKLVCFLHPKSTNGVLVEICQTIRDDE